MIFSSTTLLPFPIGSVWDFMSDIQRVGLCLPGLEELQRVGESRYAGKVKISLGPINIRLAGDLDVGQMVPENWTAVLHARAKDLRIGGEVKATLQCGLREVEPNLTRLTIETEAKILGRLGEFGQPIMKKTADRYMSQFMDGVRSKLEMVV